MDVGVSVNGVPIRLTAERWMHIVENRDELAGRTDDILDAIEQPDWVTKGYGGSLIAWKGFRRRHLAVVYRELSGADGFIITAFFTTKPKKKDRVWP